MRLGGGGKKIQSGFMVIWQPAIVLLMFESVEVEEFPCDRKELCAIRRVCMAWFNVDLLDKLPRNKGGTLVLMAEKLNKPECKRTRMVSCMINGERVDPQ